MFNKNMFASVGIGKIEEPMVMTVMEMAEYLQIGKNRAYDLLRQGDVKGFRIGSTWRVSKQALDLYIQESSGIKVI